MNQDQSKLVTAWRRLPVLLRALVAGCAVFMALQLGWNILLPLNLMLTPAIPWSVPLTLLYLWVVFSFFNGRWKPHSTSDARSESMRARRLSREEWKSALVASAFVLVFFVSATMIFYRLIDVPADDSAMPELPWWTLYAMLVMVSIVAGVSEEAGFRGYMQRPLEKRYGPVFAIAVSAIMFWLAHLNHASGVARFPGLVVMGASLGALACCARSILPAIITHAAADAITFVCSTAGIGPDYLWSPTPIKESGIDAFFWLMLLVVIVSGTSMVVTLRRLSRVTSHDRFHSA